MIHVHLYTEDAFFVGLHGRAYIVVGNFKARAVADSSIGAYGNLHGPYGTVEEAEEMAARYNDQEGR